MFSLLSRTFFSFPLKFGIVHRFGAILSVLREKGGVCRMSKEQSQNQGKNQTQNTQEQNNQTNKSNKKEQGCQNKR